MTEDAFVYCENIYELFCEDGKSYKDTVFAYGTVHSTNVPPTTRYSNAQLKTQETQGSDGVLPLFHSTNTKKNFTPRYRPEYPDDPNNCPNDNRDGVYLYSDTDYEGACHFTTENINDLGTTVVGDNNVSSAIVRGDYTVKLYEDRNQQGRSKEFSSSKSNLDSDSLGGQYSSLKIVDDSQSSSNCSPTNRPGVYLYADKNYEGACHYTNSDIAYLGSTAVGDNNVSSAKIVGLYTVKLYEHANQNGRSHEFSSNKSNLDSTSIGGSYSSLRIRVQEGSDLIEDLQIANGKNYEWGRCGKGDEIYIDRDKVFTGFSDSSYDNLWCIHTANDDKYNNSSDLITFELNDYANIYIYTDPRITNPPTWLTSVFSKNSKKVYESGESMGYFEVYSCKSHPGRITIPGPYYQGGNGGKSMYIVAFADEDSAEQLCTGVEPAVTPTSTAIPTATFPPTVTPTPTKTPTKTLTPIPTSTPDSYEPNDSFDQAVEIENGVWATHSLMPADDTDWVKFSLTSKSSIVLETTGDTGGDTTLSLYNSNINEVQFDDDSGESFYSKLESDCLESGLYYGKIEAYASYETIDEYRVLLNTTECGGTPTPTATQTMMPSPTATRTVTPSQTATRTATPSHTATRTATPSQIPTQTAIPSPTATRTAIPSPTATPYMPFGSLLYLPAIIHSNTRSCRIYTSTDVPKFISDSGFPTISSVLYVNSGGTIADVNVLNLRGTHTWIGDLDFNLQSPAGTSVQIMNPSCSGEDNFNLSLDDEAATRNWPCPPNDGGRYRPSNPLTAYDGQNKAGTWILTINDNADLDGGSLNGWSLEICTE